MKSIGVIGRLVEGMVARMVARRRGVRRRGRDRQGACAIIEVIFAHLARLFAPGESALDRNGPHLKSISAQCCSELLGHLRFHFTYRSTSVIKVISLKYGHILKSVKITLPSHCKFVPNAVSGAINYPRALGKHVQYTSALVLRQGSLSRCSRAYM